MSREGRSRSKREPNRGQSVRRRPADNSRASRRKPATTKQIREANKGKPEPAKKPKKAPKRDPWTPWGKWAKARRERRERKQREREDRRHARHQARQRRWHRRRRLTARGAVFLGLLVLACLIGTLVLLLLGRPYPWEAVEDVTNILQLTHQISERQERWSSLAINHYTVEIEYTDNNQTWCGPAVVEVVNGRVIDPPSASETHWFPADTCAAILDNLLPDNAFRWLEQQLDSYQPGVTFLEIQFDPDFGHPVQAQAGVYGDETPGCCWTATWRDLHLLYHE